MQEFSSSVIYRACTRTVHQTVFQLRNSRNGCTEPNSADATPAQHALCRIFCQRRKNASPSALWAVSWIRQDALTKQLHAVCLDVAEKSGAECSTHRGGVCGFRNIARHATAMSWIWRRTIWRRTFHWFTLCDVSNPDDACRAMDVAGEQLTECAHVKMTYPAKRV
jgi:hypothetical protein